MVDKTEKDKFLKIFPFFRNAPESLVESILSRSRCQKIPADVLIKLEGDECHDFVLMLSGEKRIYRTAGSSAREITLYEIGAGDICVLNASSILSKTRLTANAATTAETEVLLVPAEHFLDLMARYSEMRAFVYSRINEATTSIMTLLSEIAFGRMGERLISYLIEKSENGRVRKTHQQIANDLGTSREVVSRLLEDFKRQGQVTLFRKHIELDEEFFLNINEKRVTTSSDSYP